MENPIVQALVLRASQASITNSGGDMVREAVRFKIKTSALSVPSAVNIKDLFTAEAAEGATYFRVALKASIRSSGIIACLPSSAST